MEADLEKVGVLITAESIIAGFMIAYATLVTQMLFSWSRVEGASLFTTLQAGLLASAVVLTCFRSILLLYKSADHKPTDESEMAKAKMNYGAGYDLFVAAILLSGIYVIFNALSIYHFTLRLKPIALSSFTLRFNSIALSSDLVASFAELAVFFSYVFILLHAPTVIKRAVEWVSRGQRRYILEFFGWVGVIIIVATFLLYWL